MTNVRATGTFETAMGELGARVLAAWLDRDS